MTSSASRFSNSFAKRSHNQFVLLLVVLHQISRSGRRRRGTQCIAREPDPDACDAAGSAGCGATRPDCRALPGTREYPGRGIALDLRLKIIMRKRIQLFDADNRNILDLVLAPVCQSDRNKPFRCRRSARRTFFGSSFSASGIIVPESAVDQYPPGWIPIPCGVTGFLGS